MSVSPLFFGPRGIDILRTVIILGPVALALAGCIETAADTPVQEPVRPVRAETIRYEIPPQSLTLAGTVAPRQETALGFRVAGKVVARSVDIGQRVVPGQIIAELDAGDYRLQLQSMQAQVMAAEADLAKARADLTRYEGIKASPAFNAATYDQRRMAADTAAARLSQLRQQQQMMQNQLGYATLRADAAGVVTAAPVEAGQTVAAGQTIVRVARTAEKEVVVSIPEQRIPDLKAAGAVAVSLWAVPGRTYEAKLRELSPTADPALRTFTARFTIADADEAVQLGMTATLALAAAKPQPVAALPLSALFQKDGGPALWVVDPQSGALTLKPVVVAAYHESAVLIASGVQAGEMVVTAGVHKLDSAVRVRILGAARS